MLENTSAFPRLELTKEIVESAVEIYGTTLCFYEDLPALLIKKGRPDLAAVIERKIARYKRRKELNQLYAAFTAIGKRVDQRFLNGNVIRMKRKILGKFMKRKFVGA